MDKWSTAQERSVGSRFICESFAQGWSREKMRSPRENLQLETGQTENRMLRNFKEWFLEERPSRETELQPKTEQEH